MVQLVHLPRNRTAAPFRGIFMQECVISTGVNTDERDQFIPIRKSDIIAELAKSGLLIGGDQHEKFRQLCRLLGAIFHYEYFERLERLRDDYYYFNPEVPLDPKRDPQAIEEARLELLEILEKVLKGANYVEVPLSEIEQAHEEHVLRVKVETTMEHYHQVRFFRRGRHKERWIFESGSVSDRTSLKPGCSTMSSSWSPSSCRARLNRSVV